MTQFHEGQDVKVLTMVSSCVNADVPYWRKAKVAAVQHWEGGLPNSYAVQFPGGARGVFDATHIRARCPACGQDDPAHQPNEC